MRSSSLGAGFSTTVTGGATTAALTASALTLNGVAIGASVAGSGQGQSAASAFAIAQAINAASGTGVSATANSLSVVGSDPAAAGAIAANTFSINGVNVGAVANGGEPLAGQGASVAAAINLISASASVCLARQRRPPARSPLSAAGRARHRRRQARSPTPGLTAATTHATLTLTSAGSAGINCSRRVRSAVARPGLAVRAKRRLANRHLRWPRST